MGVTLTTLETPGIPFAITPIGQLHQSPPSPIPFVSTTKTKDQISTCILTKRADVPFEYSVGLIHIDAAHNVTAKI